MNAEQKAIGCPLCGLKPSIGRGGPNNLVWYIACDEQDDHTVTVLHLGTRKEAVARWNRRIHLRCARTHVYNVITKLNKAGIINKNGGKISLKDL